LLTDDELTDGSPTSVLGRHLPEAALHAIFGKKEGEMSKELALETSQSRTAVLLTVYIVSTNTAQAENVAWCFSEIPSRVFSMKPDDFFSTAEGRYESMGIDRLACMRAVVDLMGFPALVIDGGTCMTYTACNEEGHLMGGGITLGLGAKFAAIARNTQSAPGMAAVAQNHEDMILHANKMVLANERLPVFSKNTMEAVVSCTLSEISHHCRAVIKKYLDDIYVPGGENLAGDTEDGTDVFEVNGQKLQKPSGVSSSSSVPKIVLAGGDADLLKRLLQNENNQLMEPNPDIRPYDLKVCKHLMAFGVAHALKHKVKKHKETPVSEFDKLLLGCRVAKVFDQTDADGDRIYRGTIAAAVRTKGGEQQQYIVLYDDVDTEELNLVEIHGTLLLCRLILKSCCMILTRLCNTGALMLYAQTGEKLRRPPSEATALKLTEKRAKAETAAKLVEDKSHIVKAAASANRTRVNAAPKSRPISAAVAAAISNLTPDATAESKLKAVPKAATPAAAQKRKKGSPAASANKSPPRKKEKKDPESYYINKRIAKDFDGNIFFGTVSKYVSKAKYWAIDYDDGDEEEFDESEVQQHLKIYAEHRDSDPKK
jgi:pantothenate kinase type III